MSTKDKVLDRIRKGPHTSEQLKQKTGAGTKKLEKAVAALLEKGQVCERDGVYHLPQQTNDFTSGVVVKLGSGFAFVKPDDGSDDIYVPKAKLGVAFPGDEVMVWVKKSKRHPGKLEGEILRSVKTFDRMVGTVVLLDGRLWLYPDGIADISLQIRKSADGGAKPGEKVACVILERGEAYSDVRVGVVKRFGMADSARQCSKAIVFAAGLDKGFPKDVKEEAKAAASTSIPEAELGRRMDLRDEVIFTIDSASTKDMDDAINLQKWQDGYRLGVHIADVSHYVQAGSKMDKEAFKRGTSIYYADTVIPMLPQQLSNDICSLNPNEDRLAFSCIIELDRNAEVKDYSFHKTLIRSRLKGVYCEVNAVLAGEADEALQEKYAPVLDALHVAKELYEQLLCRRVERGNLEFESEEPDLVLDENGVCVDVKKRTRGISERIIEELMILANTVAARFACEKGFPFLYRVHKKPESQKLEQLASVLNKLGVDSNAGVSAGDRVALSRILENTRGTALEMTVHTAVLRSMTKAYYGTQPIGHYGLGLDDYSHFTSPIRRYPDLMIHRILSDVLEESEQDSRLQLYEPVVEAAAVQASETEKAAVVIERDCDDCYKAEYMLQFVGKWFEGIITAVTNFGFYVGLGNTIEGLVHISTFASGPIEVSDYIELTDTVTGKRYRVGDAIEVQLDGADVSRGHIDLSVAN